MIMTSVCKEFVSASQTMPPTKSFPAPSCKDSLPPRNIMVVQTMQILQRIAETAHDHSQRHVNVNQHHDRKASAAHALVTLLFYWQHSLSEAWLSRPFATRYMIPANPTEAGSQACPAPRQSPPAGCASQNQAAIFAVACVISVRLQWL